MDARKFSVSSEDRIFSAGLYLLGASVWFVPIVLIIILRGPWAEFYDYIFNVSDNPTVFLFFTGLTIVLLSTKVWNSALRCTILASDLELIQLPWLGNSRKIRWDDVERIQVLDMTGYRGMRAFRIRVFSKKTVIVFTDGISDYQTLIDIIQEKAQIYNIPVFREEKIGATRLVFGSWGIDDSGKSAGISVTRIANIRAA